MDINTPQAEKLIAARACSPELARIVGLSFADRDLDLIAHLKTLLCIPEEAELPTPQACVTALGLEARWGPFILHKVARFMHKARIGTDISADVEHFCALPDAVALRDRCRKLRPGVTAFIGDSHMDNRHFGANVPYSVLAGSYLRNVGVGEYINAGIGGEQTRQGLARYQRDVLDHRPARIVIAFGGNDLTWKFTFEEITANLQRMIEMGRKIGADVAMGAFPAFLPEKTWYFGQNALTAEQLDTSRKLDGALRELAGRLGVPRVEAFERLADECFCVDGIHLNQSGHEMCAIETLRVMCGEGV